MRRITSQEALAWCERFPETREWLADLASSSAALYAKGMLRLHDLTGETPAQLLELAREGKRRGEPVAERHLEAALRNSGFDIHMKRHVAGAARSFYAHHLFDLAKKALRVEVARKKPIRCPTQEELHDFKAGMNIRDAAIVDFLASVPVREETLTNLKWRHVWEEVVEKPKTPAHVGLMGHELKGGGVRQYKDLEMHAFLHDDAAKSLLRYKHWREEVQGEEVTLESWLFGDLNKAPDRRHKAAADYGKLGTAGIRRIFERASRRTGLTLSPHDLRRFFETQCEEARLQPNWIRKLMGKTIKSEEAPYSRPKIEQLRKDFKTAVPFLTLAPKPPDETAQRKRAILDAARLLLPPEKIAALENIMAHAKTMPEVDEGIRNITAATKGLPSSPDRGIENITAKAAEKTKPEDEDCQKIVSEEDLGNHLSHGWRVAAVLPSGRVVIEHNGAGPGPGSEA